MVKFEFEGIGTHWQIDIYKDLSKEEEVFLLDKIKSRIEIFDKDYSRFRADSLVTEISKKAGIYKMPADFEKMWSLYVKIYKDTNGLVTPLIGKVLEDSGYDSNYSLEKKEMESPKKLEEVLEWQKPNLILKEPGLLDFGAAGKGYLVDIVSEIIESVGIDSYCVDASGDMRVRGRELRIGLEDPENSEMAIGVLELKNQSLCGSSGNRRKWADMHHIINPETLKSPVHISAVWVIAQDTLIADILTTCLFFVEPENLRDFNFEYLILNKDKTIKKSTGFDAEFFVG